MALGGLAKKVLARALPLSAQTAAGRCKSQALRVPTEVQCALTRLDLRSVIAPVRFRWRHGDTVRLCVAVRCAVTKLGAADEARRAAAAERRTESDHFTERRAQHGVSGPGGGVGESQWCRGCQW